MEQVIRTPTEADVDRLAHQAVRASQLALAQVGRSFLQDESDIRTLQELIDFLPARVNRSDLECLGCVFGIRLAHAVEGFDWAIVEDDHGREAALRYADTSLVVFPLSMIANRVEDGAVDVAELFAETCARLEALKAEVIGPH